MNPTINPIEKTGIFAAVAALKNKTKEEDDSDITATIAPLKNKTKEEDDSDITATIAPPLISPIRLNLDRITASIKAERINQNLTQRQLALKAHMSERTVTRIEKHGYMSVKALLKITNGLGKEIKLN